MGRGAWWTTVHGSHRVRHDQATGGAHMHRKSLKSQRIFSCSWKNWGPGVPQKAPSGAVFSLCVCALVFTGGPEPQTTRLSHAGRQARSPSQRGVSILGFLLLC